MNAEPAAAANASHVIEIERVLRDTHQPTFQMMLFALCGLCPLIDGFDAQAMGYVAPGAIGEWHVSKVIGPLVGGQLIALNGSSASLFQAAAMPLLCSALLVIVLAGVTRQRRRPSEPQSA